MSSLSPAAIQERGCNSGFTLSLTITFEAEATGDKTSGTQEYEPLEIVVTPEATVKEIKILINEKRCISTLWQQLYRTSHGSPSQESDGMDEPIYSGCIVNGPMSTHLPFMTLKCLVKEPNHLLLSLFSVTSLGDEWERAELMQRMQTDGVDPVERIQSLALHIARQRASVAAWFGGKGHWCGHPPVQFTEELAKYQPREFAMDKVRRVSRNTIVLHPGVRVMVLLSNRLKELLPANVQEQVSTEHTIGDSGATLQYVFAIRNQLKENTSSWQSIQQSLREEFPTYETRRGTPPLADERLTFQSYSLEEVVYLKDVIIENDDY
jgi:hypothetical protein